MKHSEKIQAILLRKSGLSISEIASSLKVAKSSVSNWVRDVPISQEQRDIISARPFTQSAVEKRRKSRLVNELAKRNKLIQDATNDVDSVNTRELWLIGVMLYWAEGGKTQRMVRFSNGDPEMIKIMMEFYRRVCQTPESKFRGHIHIHHNLSVTKSEKYWSEITGIPLEQFFKTYSKPRKYTSGAKDTLPHGVMDIYVLDTKLFLKITGWARGIFASY